MKKERAGSTDRLNEIISHRREYYSQRSGFFICILRRFPLQYFIREKAEKRKLVFERKDKLI